jgi:cobalt/nickel transport system permease protein
MSHLHVPDGVLPIALWLPGLAVALLLLVPSVLATRRAKRPSPGFQAALGGLMLAVMSIPIPLFAMEYCLTLGGPIGVLLGPAAAFQTVFVASVILALLGQGGLTVVGLNALVLGAGAALARPVYLALRARMSAPAALAGATALSQIAAGTLWFGLLALALRLDPELAHGGLAGDHGHDHGLRVSLLAGVTFAMWAIAIAIEAAVAFGIGRFLGRVRPDLLPEPGRAAEPVSRVAS